MGLQFEQIGFLKDGENLVAGVRHPVTPYLLWGHPAEYQGPPSATHFSIKVPPPKGSLAF